MGRMRFHPARLFLAGFAIGAPLFITCAFTACGSDNPSSGPTVDAAKEAARDTAEADAAQSGFTQIVGVAAGTDFSCALNSVGDVYCWGGSRAGETGSDFPTSTPAKVQGLPIITQIAVDNEIPFACAIDQATDVWCWGDNANGELGTGAIDQDSHSIPAKVQSNGADFSGAKQIVLGAGTACAIMSDRSVMCWGGVDTCEDDGGGQCDGGLSLVQPTGVPNLVATHVSLGLGFGCATGMINGESTVSVSCWGQNAAYLLGSSLAGREYLDPQAVTIEGFSAPAGIASGTLHTCAFDVNGAVFCWGETVAGNGVGVTDGGLGTFPIAVSGFDSAIGIACGEGTTCALLKNENIACVGKNSRGQLGAAIAATASSESATPVTVKNIASATSISVGQHHACAVAELSGEMMPSVVCWGANDQGQLGDGTTNDSNTPVRVVAQ